MIMNLNSVLNPSSEQTFRQLMRDAEDIDKSLQKFKTERAVASRIQIEAFQAYEKEISTLEDLTNSQDQNW